MKSVVRWMIGVLGVLLLVVGVIGAGYVGSDDEVMLGRHRIGAPGDRLMVAGPDLFSYRRLDLVVEAHNIHGVRVGWADPIDAADLTKGVAHFYFNSMSAGRVHGRHYAGAAPRLPAPGSGVLRRAGHGRSVHLVVRVDPRDRLVIVPDSPGAATSVRIGARFTGLFALLLGIAGLGLLLLVGVGLWTARRRSARRARSGAGEDSAVAAYNMALRAVLVASVAGAVLATTGCLAVPQRVVTDSDRNETKPGLLPGEAKGLLADYDARVNSAIAAANPPRYDGTKWSAANAGGVLMSDRFTTSLARLQRSKTRTDPMRSQLIGSYSPAFSGYPMWSCVIRRTLKSGSGKPLDDKSYVDLGCFVRDHAGLPWRAAYNIPVKSSLLPTALLAGKRSTASTADRQRAASLLRGLERSWESGRRPARFVDEKATRGPRSLLPEMRKDDDRITRSVLSLKPLTVADGGAAGVDPGPLVFRAEGGVLAVKAAMVDVNAYLPGGQIGRFSKGYDRLWGGGALLYYVIPYVADYAIWVPDRGGARVLGLASRYRVPASKSPRYCRPMGGGCVD